MIIECHIKSFILTNVYSSYTTNVKNMHLHRDSNPGMFPRCKFYLIPIFNDLPADLMYLLSSVYIDIQHKK